MRHGNDGKLMFKTRKGGASLMNASMWRPQIDVPRAQQLAEELTFLQNSSKRSEDRCRS